MFDCLPFSAVIEDKILCVHAGLSPELQSLEQLKSIPRPTEIPDAGLICDLLWSDPEEGQRGWGESDRGVSFVFGEDVVTKFLARTDLDLVARAHQVYHPPPGPGSFAPTTCELSKPCFRVPVDRFAGRRGRL